MRLFHEKRNDSLAVYLAQLLLSLLSLYHFSLHVFPEKEITLLMAKFIHTWLYHLSTAGKQQPSQALSRTDLCDSILRPVAGTKDVESCRPGCALDSSEVHIEAHPPCGDVPKITLSKTELSMGTESELC